MLQQLGFFGTAGTQPCSLRLQLLMPEPGIPPWDNWAAKLQGHRGTRCCSHCSCIDPAWPCSGTRWWHSPAPRAAGWIRDQSQPSEEELPSGPWERPKQLPATKDQRTGRESRDPSLQGITLPRDTCLVPPDAFPPGKAGLEHRLNTLKE